MLLNICCNFVKKEVIIILNHTNGVNVMFVENIIKEHNEFFLSNKTLDIDFRIQQLNKLKKSLKAYENKLTRALKKDLGKGRFESYCCEIGFELNSISNTIKNLKKWAQPKKEKTPFYLFPSKSYIVREPYGTVLIIGPYNYPVHLVLEPLIGAIAAGNCVVLKLSELTPNVSEVLKEMISFTFSREYIRAITGGEKISNELIHGNFDYIFFTGSERVGKIVMKAASENLTPVTLELGGKSPVIVDESADLKTAAQRIIWGKTLNAGQTCVAPDYLLAHESIKDELIKELKGAIKDFYGEDIQKSKDFCRIVNEKHFYRIKHILDEDEEYIVLGGRTDYKENYIEPTILELPSWEGASMNEEIFGPVLPIIGYNNINKVIYEIRKRPKPLALYLFTTNEEHEKLVLSSISSGGACINDTISHLINHNLPFGGVGNSGFGAYHGEYSFKTFSHEKSILKKKNKPNLKITYPPYKGKLNLIKEVFR